jgi:hypothetical protein
MGAKRHADNELHTQVAIKTEADVYSKKKLTFTQLPNMILSISGNYLCMSKTTCEKFIYYCIWRLHYTVQFYLHLSLFPWYQAGIIGKKILNKKFLTVFMLDDAFGARHSQSKCPLHLRRVLTSRTPLILGSTLHITTYLYLIEQHWFGVWTSVGWLLMFLTTT